METIVQESDYIDYDRSSGEIDENAGAALASNEDWETHIADNDHGLLNQYLREIGQHPLLSVEETDMYARRYHDTGDQHAASQLVLANLRLVVKVVMDFQKFWMNNFLDLIQEGNVGLSRAVKKFDPDRGVKFSSYAVYWIRAHILKYIMDNWRLVRIGTTQGQRKLFYKLNKEKKFLESKGIKPESSLLAKRLEVSESEVVEMGRRLDNSDLSLESPVRAGASDEQKSFLVQEGPSVEEKIADDQFRRHFHKRLKELSKNLNEREQAILSDRLLSEEARTLHDLASQFHVSRERIRQVEIGLLKKLRKNLDKEFRRNIH